MKSSQASSLTEATGTEQAAVPTAVPNWAPATSQPAANQAVNDAVSSESVDLWRSHPIFRAATPFELESFASHYRIDRFADGEQIFDAGEPSDYVYLLFSGNVRVYQRTPDGRQTLVKLLCAPNTFGDISAFHELPYMESAAALGPVQVARVDAAHYAEFLKANPNAMWAQLKHLTAASCVSACNDRSVFATLEERVANILLTYADAYGVTTASESIEVRYPLSQQDLALALGAVRRSVANVIGKFQAQRWIEKNGDFFSILNPVELQRLAAPISGSLMYQMGMPLQLAASVPDVTPGSLLIEHGPLDLMGQQLPVGREVTFGSESPSQVVVSEGGLSGLHCRIFRAATGNRYWIEDFQSVNGTFVDDKRINRAVLRDGQVIKMADGLQVRFIQRD